MRHNVSGRKLNMTAAHRNAMFRNMITDLFRHERVTTTTPKAKEARALAERLITHAKSGELGARRLVARSLKDPEVLRKLFAEIAPRYAERPGGYTRILKLDGRRKGDNAELAILELVDAKAKPRVKDTEKRKQRRRVLKAEEKAAEAARLEQAAAGAAAAAPATPAAESAAEEAGADRPAAADDESKS